MALGNPLHGKRIAGTVGSPFPNVNVKIMNDDGKNVIDLNAEGELFVKGPQVTPGYYNNLKATSETFTTDNW